MPWFMPAAAGAPAVLCGLTAGAMREPLGHALLPNVG